MRSSRPTCSLEVEGHQLGAAQPHGQGVVVGGVQALAAGVDPGQLQTVVLQELLALHLVHVLLRLGLRERRHVPETGPLSADLCRGGGRGTISHSGTGKLRPGDLQWPVELLHLFHSVIKQLDLIQVSTVISIKV